MLPKQLILSLAVTTLAFASATTSAADAIHDTSDWHSDFDRLLKQNVDNGFVDYSGFASNSTFNDYVEYLQAPVPAGLTRNQQLAYWINAYNALSIKGIVDGYSPSSLFGRWKFFKSIEYTIGGKTLNLHDLEREVIIPIGESRIHFAIVCASHSCPPLRAEAYAAERLNEQLDDQARTFLNNPEVNRYDSAKQIAYLSKIFDWFEHEFAASAGSVQEYVAKYVDDANVRQALAQQQYRVKHLNYDWSLNGSEP